MPKIVLLRHGESTWNHENRFTGWTDVGLSPKGESEALRAGQLLLEAGFKFDVAFTSVLKRAIRTLWTVLETIDQMWIPEIKSWRLNERHYGALQGMNKKEMTEKYGEQRVFDWRRGYDVLPPLLEKTDPRHPSQDPRYADLQESLLPSGESLKTTLERVLPFWHEVIAPHLKRGQRVLIAAHGNSLRALIKYLDQIPDDQISDLNIPTGIPLVYELSENFKPIKSYYLGDPDEARRAADAVAAQALGRK